MMVGESNSKGVVPMRHAQTCRERRSPLSVADALMIMIAFGNFILTLIDIVIIIIFTHGNEKNRH